jgi:hypothetical protein
MRLIKVLVAACLFFGVSSYSGCNGDTHPANTSALEEQAHTENNQRDLMKTQPPPTITWSLERDNLISRFRLQNDRSVNFFMYVFIEGVADPIGYYQVNKVSSVNSQLTNTMQIISGESSTNNIPSGVAVAVPSPAEDGSYGTNGDGVFGFTPEGIYIETNMKYITATVPLSFTHPVNRLAIITTDEARAMLANSKKAMGK